VLNAYANFTLPQLSSPFPDLNGDPVEQILLAATLGELSTITLVTRSGKELRPDQLPVSDQLKLGAALGALADRR
jgi:hypothetical protein